MPLSSRSRPRTRGGPRWWQLRGSCSLRPAFAGFGAAYWQNYSNFWLAITFAVGFAGLGYGMVVWGKYLMPRGPF